MKKKCKVVVISANEKANSLKGYKDKSLISPFKNSYIDSNSKVEEELSHFHLYIISDAEIKEGDWYCNIVNNTINQCKHSEQYFENEFKVIATTNKLFNLPQPSQSFVTKFIEEWNKGNKITEVMVEYEELNQGCSYKESEFLGFDREPMRKIQRPKLDKNNEITITRVKDSWNREEVRNIAQAMYYMGRDELKESQNKYKYIDNLDKWIEENL